MSLEPDLNQRPKDICMKAIYSPPLYQLSYRGLSDERTINITFERKPQTFTYIRIVGVADQNAHADQNKCK